MNYQRSFVVLILTLLVAACGGGGGGGASAGGGGGPDPVSPPVSPPPPPPPPPTGSQSVGELYDDMESWDEFAPKERDEADEGIELSDPEEEPFVEEVTDPNNNLKVCTTESVDFYKTPREYTMFQPPTNVLYPAAMVVGKSLRDTSNPSELLPIDIEQRTEVDVSIEACKFAGNTRRVPPTLAAVNAAIGDIIFQAQQEGVDCINANGNLRVETYRNENQRALRAGLSGRYLGFSARASGSYSKTNVENSVAAVFQESLYTVDISAPQTPEGWFTDEFTEERVEEQKKLGKMDDDNIPVYVARVTYGRLMMATMTSTYSEDEMRSAFEFKYQNPAAGVSGDAAARSQKVREESKMTLSYYGGSSEATTEMLQSNDWTEYFGSPVTAEDAVPISFELRSTKDNVPAVVQEFTSYERTTCVDKVGDDATFALSNELTFTPGFSAAGQVVAVGDIDGENGDDIVWAATSLQARGEYAVALSNGDGTFETLVQDEIPEANGFAGDFSLHLVDVDNDGRDDIVLNTLPSSGTNTAWVAFYKDDAFVHSAPQELNTSSGWNTYTAYTGQMDKENGIDLVFNNVPESTTVNRTYIATAVDTTVAGFDLESDALFVMQPFVDRNGNFSGYEYTHIADFNGDGHDDIMWHNIDQNTNGFYAAFGTPTGLELRPYQNLGGSWGIYTALAGDADGNGVADLIEPRTKGVFNVFGIYIGEGTGVGIGRGGAIIDPHTFRLRNRADEEASIRGLFGPATPDSGDDPNLAESPPVIFLADVDGNGTDDMIINDKGKRDGLTNQVGVGLGVVGGSEYTFTRVSQAFAPAQDWSQYEIRVGDVNGDGKEDVLWIESAATNSVFVGISR